MKKGDVVIIIDSSWSKSVIDGKLKKELLNHSNNQNEYGSIKNRKYIVVETDCSFPLESGFTGQPNEYRNDTVIQDTLSDKVVFIHHRFLKEYSVREVTMAEVCDKFGEEVKIKKD